MTNKARRGDIYYIDIPQQTGSIQWGKRPCVVIQNDIGNRHSPTCIVAVITTRQKHNLPTHVKCGKTNGLERDSTILCEQLRTINQDELGTHDFPHLLGRLDSLQIEKLNAALQISIIGKVDANG